MTTMRWGTIGLLAVTLCVGCSSDVEGGSQAEAAGAAGQLLSVPLT